MEGTADSSKNLHVYIIHFCKIIYTFTLKDCLTVGFNARCGVEQCTKAVDMFIPKDCLKAAVSIRCSAECHSLKSLILNNCFCLQGKAWTKAGATYRIIWGGRRGEGAKNSLCISIRHWMRQRSYERAIRDDSLYPSMLAHHSAVPRGAESPSGQWHRGGHPQPLLLLSIELPWSRMQKQHDTASV